MRVVHHKDLSPDNRFQAIHITKEGDKIIAFAPSQAQAIAKAYEQAVCRHIFKVTEKSRFKKCRKCLLIIKEK